MATHVSTHINPFSLGGWSGKHCPRRDILDNCTPRQGATEQCIPPQSIFGALPAHAELSPSRDLSAAYVPPFGLIARISDTAHGCTVLGPNNRVLYNVVHNNPTLSVVMDSERKSIALIEWSCSMPTVQLRGLREKKKMDDWLMPDPSNPAVRYMLWGGLWYHWSTERGPLHLYSPHDQHTPLAMASLWDSTFQLGVTTEALQLGLLDAAVIALLMMQWRSDDFSPRFR